MTLPSKNEFVPYRFVRDARGEVVSLSPEGAEGTTRLVLDCERWGLARLRILPGAALRADQLKSFQEDVEVAARIRSSHFPRVLSWGRDGEDLFYADEILDGEPLTNYLGRTGGVPARVACEWTLELMYLFESIQPLSGSQRDFSTSHFEVVMNRAGRVLPVFSEWYRWPLPDSSEGQRTVVSNCAQIFCALVAGVPISTITRDVPPEHFVGIDPVMRDVVLRVLERGGEDSGDAFRSVIHSGAATASEERSKVESPLMPVREWLRRDLEATGGDTPNYLLEPDFDPTGEPYAVPVQLRGSPAHLQLLPGPDAIPREGWLTQHHTATRRPGRGMLHQLQVNYIEDRDSITLIGEERIDGVDLRALIERTGPLPLASVKDLAGAIHTALDSLEKQVGACAVWWLPEENVLLITGTRSLSGSVGLIERKGSGAWASFPLKFRLHQTLPALKEGVNLPSKVRDLSRLSGKRHESARRSAVALPLLWYLLSGTRFCWKEAVVATDQIPGALAEIFEHFRQELWTDPVAVTDNLFLTFSQWSLCEAAPKEESVPEKEKDKRAAGEREDSLNQILKATLYDGDLELVLPEPEPEPSPEDLSQSVEQEEHVVVVLPVVHEPEPAGKELSVAVGFQAFILGFVAAAVVGFSLSEWNFRQGLFREAESAVFPIPEFRFQEGASGEVARFHLGNLLLTSDQTDSLALLPAVARLDLETNREQIQAWLKTGPESGKGEAFRVLGLLAMSGREAPELSSSYFLAGAKKGDPESRFWYTVSQWSEQTGFAEAEALSVLEGAAGHGHVAAQELLARAKLLQNDSAGARKWAESAARLGRPSALHLLGLFCLKGIGSEPDPASAVDFLRSAAELGDERAMYDYGRCLSEGRGVEPSFSEAQRWMRLAASRGHGAALLWCRGRSRSIGGERLGLIP